jgi:hypothetical protein
MATSPLTLTPVGGGPYAVVSGRLLQFPIGAWLADLELSADSVQQNGVPTGKVVVVFGGVSLSGTIDPTASGSFGPTARVRVVAGGGGWGNLPPAQDWAADNGVLSTTVYQSTAAAVGEVVNDVTPQYFSGVQFVRSSQDPASAVFRDAQWWVDFAGVTQVAPRPPGVADPSLVIRDWDPVSAKVTFSTDTILLPNTLLIDPRFNGPGPTVQTVEQVFDGHGSIGWAWAGAGPTTAIVGDLKAAALFWTRARLLRHYRYRLVTYQGDGPGGPPSRQALQAVTPAAGVPDLIPLLPTFGAAGLVSTLSPSQEVLVGFENADPTKPWILSYSPVGKPLKNELDALEEVDVGASAAMVNLAGGEQALATAPAVEQLIAALGVFAGACESSLTDPVLVAAATALATALSPIPALVPTLRTKAT